MCIITLFDRFSRHTRRSRVYRLSWTNRSHRCHGIPRSYRFSGITWRTWLYGISWRSRLDRSSRMDRRSRYVICIAFAYRFSCLLYFLFSNYAVLHPLSVSFVLFSLLFFTNFDRLIFSERELGNGVR